jgi:hypothetical protein
VALPASKLVFFCSLVRPLGEKFVAVSQIKYGSLGFRGDEFCGVTASVFGAFPPMLAVIHQQSDHIMVPLPWWRGPIDRFIVLRETGPVSCEMVACEDAN